MCTLFLSIHIRLLTLRSRKQTYSYAQPCITSIYLSGSQRHRDPPAIIVDAVVLGLTASSLNVTNNRSHHMLTSFPLQRQSTDAYHGQTFQGMPHGPACDTFSQCRPCLLSLLANVVRYLPVIPNNKSHCRRNPSYRKCGDC